MRKTITVLLVFGYWVVSAWALMLAWNYFWPTSDITFGAALGVRLVALLCQTDTSLLLDTRERLFNEFVGVVVMFFAVIFLHFYLS